MGNDERSDLSTRKGRANWVMRGIYGVCQEPHNPVSNDELYQRVGSRLRLDNSTFNSTLQDLEEHGLIERSFGSANLTDKGVTASVHGVDEYFVTNIPTFSIGEMNGSTIFSNQGDVLINIQNTTIIKNEIEGLRTLIETIELHSDDHEKIMAMLDELVSDIQTEKVTKGSVKKFGERMSEMLMKAGDHAQAMVAMHSLMRVVMELLHSMNYDK